MGFRSGDQGGRTKVYGRGLIQQHRPLDDRGELRSRDHCWRTRVRGKKQPSATDIDSLPDTTDGAIPFPENPITNPQGERKALHAPSVLLTQYFSS